MKHHDRWTIKRSTRSMLWGSALSMLLSCALFAGATHAWFTDRCSAQITLQSATFDVEVVVTPEEGMSSISPDANGVYNLSTGTYTVTLKRAGKGTVGYCEITVGDDVYCSPNLPAQTNSFSFPLMIAGENVSVTFTPVWSDAAQADPDLIPISETGITYADPNAATLSGEPETEGTAEPESDETAQAEPDETTQTGTNNSAGDNPETGEGPTESSNSSGSEPAGETGAEGASAGDTAETSGSANG